MSRESAPPAAPAAPASSKAPAPPLWRRVVASPRSADALIALAFAVAYAALLLRTTADLGYARDEGFYFQAAQSYARWFELLFTDPSAALSRRAVDSAWTVNHEHPSLIKSLFALSNLFLQRKLKLFAMEGTSYRFPAIALAGAVVGLVYLWGARARGRLAGVTAAVLLAAMPRFFYQAHLACFDVPIVAVWTLCAYCYWTSLKRGGARWPILTGVVFGLALDTKHNAWFLPIAFAAHAGAIFVFRRVLDPWLRERGQSAPTDEEARSSGEASGDVTARRALAALVAMATLGPLVFYALWPWIWRDTLSRLHEYVMFHLHHEYYNMEFLGRNYWTPPMPRAYAPVMTAATVPAVTLALALAGLCARALIHIRALQGARAGVRAHEPLDAAATDLLWLLCLTVSYAAWLSPTTPIFGGTKHWMTAYPFLALFAGVGFSEVVRAVRRALRIAARRARAEAPSAARLARGPLVPVALFLCVAAAPVVETARSHPWGLSSYTPLVGGASGAATLGLNRTFWGYTTGAVVDYLNREVPRGGSVYIHDTAGQAWDMLVRDGRLRKDIRGAWSIAGADFGLYHHELHMLGQEYQNWVAFGTAAPAHIGGLDGVPVILVYKNPSVDRARVR